MTVTASGEKISVTADGSQTLNATSDATASSSGGSAYGSGTSIAVGASIVTNTVQGGAQASVTNSSLTTNSTTADQGNIKVEATNSAVINAVNKSAITSGDTAVGVTLAFNTLGYQSQNVLTRAINAILQTDIGTAAAAQTRATITDTTVIASGDIDVKAHSDAQLKAELTNETESAASALVNASGMAIGTVLSSNMVKSGAHADIDFTGTSKGSVTADGNITVEARDRSGIDAESQLDAISTTTNDGGVSTAIAWANQFLDNQSLYTTKSGRVELL